MAETPSEDSRMGASVTKGILIGVPAGTVLMTVVFWLLSDLDLLGAIGAALLPGVSFGVFAGGFAGMAMAMSKEH